MAEIGKDIHKAIDLLLAGKLVAIPTETVYGLAANALNEKAVAGIFEAKNRPHFDPLIVHISSIDQLSQYAKNIPAKAMYLAEKFWPGPLTLVLNKSDLIPDLVSSGLNTVGIRMPNHHLTLELLKKLAFPLAAPSANPFGYVSPTRASHVNDQLGDKIEYILDGGHSEMGLESTIIGFDDYENPQILRLGALSLEEINNTLAGSVRLNLNQHSNPLAPGQLDSHYSPKKRMHLLNDEEISDEIKHNPNVVYLRFKENLSFHNVLGKQWILSPNGDFKEAAANLFHYLRELDRSQADFIIAQPAPNFGLGLAINDRLYRASKKI